MNLPRRTGWIVTLAILLVAGRSSAATTDVNVGPGFVYSPSMVQIQAGDTVQWTWKGSNHSVTSGVSGQPSGLFDSGVHGTNHVFSFTFPNGGTFPYYCSVHGGCCGMIGSVVVAAPSPTPTPTPTPRPPSLSQLLNISTRMRVQTEDNALIGGLIITGNDPKKVILRAIGPSLAEVGVVGALADPVLELHASDGSLITMNDNWKETQQAEIEASGVPPQDDLESAIVMTLNPGPYTAIVNGKGETTGVGLVEGYDLDQAADSQLANISTRGFVETESNVMIGGFILGNDPGTANVLIRGLGPSLSGAGVTNALADPVLELHDANGAVVMSNDNWKESQQAEIEATGIPPQNDLESAMVVTIDPAAYTAIVFGKNAATGVGLVEVYRLP